MANGAKTAFKGLFKKGDLILVAVLIVAVALTVWYAVRDEDRLVQIYVDGTLKYELDINADKEIALLDGRVKVVVRDGEVWIEESDCKEQLCVQSAHLTSSGGMIVCLPNKVVVKVAPKEVAAIS